MSADLYEHVDKECFRLYVRFIRRHIRYAPIVIALYGYSLFQWKKARPLRAGFALAQAVDDILDGDWQIQSDPIELTRLCVRDPSTVHDNGLKQICVYLIPWMKEHGLLDSLSSLFETLILDCKRRSTREQWPGEKLKNHHFRTFELSAKIALGLCELELSPADARGVIESLAWVSPMRDLREDLEKGINNIPSEVVDTSRMTAKEALSNRRVIEWMKTEYQSALLSLDRSNLELKRIQDRKGAVYFGIFHRLVKSYARKYPRKYPEILSC